MGRAIVREPQVVPDGRAALEPRREAARPDARRHRASSSDELETTTIYVTHDQVEAMTMGDRVAVMSQGELQQVDTPAAALRRAGEPLRGRLHRHAADEPDRGARCSPRTEASCSPSGRSRSCCPTRRSRATRASARRGREDHRARRALGGPLSGARTGPICRPSTAQPRAARGARLGDRWRTSRRRRGDARARGATPTRSRRKRRARA